MIEWYQLLFSHNQCPVFCLVTNAPGSYDPPSTKKHCGTAVFSYFFVVEFASFSLLVATFNHNFLRLLLLVPLLV